jgi:hypothetical protein
MSKPVQNVVHKFKNSFSDLIESQFLGNKRSRSEEEEQETFSPRLLNLLDILEKDQSFIQKYENNLLNSSKGAKEKRKFGKDEKQTNRHMQISQENEYGENNNLNIQRSKSLYEIERSFSRKIKESMLKSSSMVLSEDFYRQVENVRSESDSSDIQNFSTSGKTSQVIKSFDFDIYEKSPIIEKDLDNFSDQEENSLDSQDHEEQDNHSIRKC